jgi:hypothetical protein
VYFYPPNIISGKLDVIKIYTTKYEYYVKKHVLRILPSGYNGVFFDPEDGDDLLLRNVG